MNQAISYFFELGFIVQIIVAAFITGFLIQFFFYVFFYMRVFAFKYVKKETKKETIPLSVVICAKNEGNNLKGFLTKVLEQDYPDFEVIVVNHASEDHTNAVLNTFRKEHSNLYVTFLEKNPKFSHGKKLALTIGIKAAKHRHLVFTDADCRPETNQWLHSIAGGYNRDSTKIVLAYGGYLRRRGLLNKLIRFDTLFIALQYMSFAKAGLPYMGVGRNMSYHKELYESVKGFSAHYHIQSGDDDLFINQVANKVNTNIVVGRDSIVRSVPKKRLSEYIHQKRRHLSTGKHYKFKHKFLLGTELLGRFLFYAAFIASIVVSVNSVFVFGLFGFMFLVKYAVIYKSGTVFEEKDIVIFSLFFDIFIPLLNLWAVLSKYFIKNKINQRW